MMLSYKVIPSQVSEETTIPYIPPLLEKVFDPSQWDESLLNPSGGFVLDKVQEEISGLDKAHQSKVDILVQEEVLRKMQSIQEEAYKKGFELGQQEGHIESFKETSLKIHEEMQAVLELVGNLQDQVEQMGKQNESRLVELAFKIGSKLALKTLEFDKQAIIEVVRDSVSRISVEDKVILELNPQLLNFFEELQSKTGRDVDFLKKIIMEPNESISLGGCIVRTDFGQIDSQWETRIENLWNHLNQVIPQVS
jgi:flagellar assembly protein FliH